ncbi:MAG: trigger factor [Parcubacteria bacterium C7867-005]|nr:MAG: trigger factor [Parcubacteria bacterium C7867-005]
MSKHFDDIKSKSLPNSMVEINGRISKEFIAECRKEAIKELNSRVDFPGFRKGHIPEDILVKRLGEMAILEEAAEIALGREYRSIITEAKIVSIGEPVIAVTKLALGIGLEFKITTAVEPEFKLPNYKKIAKEFLGKEEKISITDKEVEEVLAEITKREIKPDLKEGENINDKIKTNLIKEKELRAKEKTRLSIIDSLIKETEIAVPEIFIRNELEKMIGQFKDDVSRAGLKWEDYLISIKKLEDEVRKEWQPKAIDRAKAELIVAKIAVEEKIEPTNEELEHETTHLLAHYPEADPLRARMYIYSQMRNEKVFEFLETI